MDVDIRVNTEGEFRPIIHSLDLGLFIQPVTIMMELRGSCEVYEVSGMCCRYIGVSHFNAA